MLYLRRVWAIVRKDLAAEMRSREMVSAMLVFALVVILVFNFAFDMRAARAIEVAPGVLWVAFAFSGMLGLGRSFILERDQGCLDGLLLCPSDRSIIYLGKMLGNLLFISIIEVASLPVFIAIFNLPLELRLLPVILLGTIGLAAVGTLFSAMTVQARAREVLLPVLVLPIIIPVLIAAVKLTAGLLDGQPWDEIAHWFHFLLGYDALFLAISYMTFDFVVEE
jgi:heme exporter protein B